jgi:hypothetical protein
MRTVLGAALHVLRIGCALGSLEGQRTSRLQRAVRDKIRPLKGA